MEKKTNWWVIGGILSILVISASAFTGPESKSQPITNVPNPALESQTVNAKDWALPAHNESKNNSAKTTNETTEQKTIIVEKLPVAMPVQNCHPSYSGCLKLNQGDYDCASGSGNGPNYTGPVEVYGSDPFDLDRDNDGWGCE